MKLRHATLIICLHLGLILFAVLALTAANAKALFLLAFVAVPVLFWHTWRMVRDVYAQNDPLDVNIAGPDTPMDAGAAAVDPWEYQRQLMEMSGQRVMRQPTLTKEAILYGALVMEEAGETFIALSRAIDYMVNARFAAGVDITGMPRLSNVFANRGMKCESDSSDIREMLALLDGNGWRFDTALPEDIAVELLDGATDVVVVTAGLAHAAGLPGAAAYDEVVCSNMSKANPGSGKIEKTADGKWIKGPDYRQPDLARVLAEHAA